MYMRAVLKGAEAAETKTDFEENSRGGSCTVRQNIEFTVTTGRPQSAETIYLLQVCCFWRNSPPVGQGLLIH
jgi:hypothetical protein